MSVNAFPYPLRKKKKEERARLITQKKGAPARQMTRVLKRREGKIRDGPINSGRREKEKEGLQHRIASYMSPSVIKKGGKT